jgi:hypothetical protein
MGETKTRSSHVPLSVPRESRTRDRRCPPTNSASIPRDFGTPLFQTGISTIVIRYGKSSRPISAYSTLLVDDYSPGADECLGSSPLLFKLG